MNPIQKNSSFDSSFNSRINQEDEEKTIKATKPKNNTSKPYANENLTENPRDAKDNFKCVKIYFKDIKKLEIKKGKLKIQKELIDKDHEIKEIDKEIKLLYYKIVKETQDIKEFRSSGISFPLLDPFNTKAIKRINQELNDNENIKEIRTKLERSIDANDFLNQRIAILTNEIQSSLSKLQKSIPRNMKNLGMGEF